MRRFEVLEGTHIQDGREYGKGEIVLCHDDLNAAFPLKFRELHTPAEVAAVVGRQVGGPGPAPAAPTAHAIRNDSPANAEDGVVAGVGRSNPVKAGTKAGKQPAKPVTPPGKDVTVKFPKAGEQDYVVYRDKGEYFVYDEDDLSKTVNPDGKGVDKDEVDAVIDGALK